LRVLDYTRVENLLIDYIKYEFNTSGFNKAVINLSGGLDSSVIAYLTVKALGNNNVTGLLLPYKGISSKESVDDAVKISDLLGINYIIKEINDIVDIIERDMFTNINNSKLRKGNVMARVRMMLAFDFSSANDALVMGSSMLTEEILGYFTLWGDHASCIEPMIQLYKTEVFKLAEHLNVPIEIIKKSPSAELWLEDNGELQSDEQELGISYDIIDDILYHIIDKKWDENDFKQNKYDMSSVVEVMNKINKMKYKLELPKHPLKDILNVAIV